MLASEVFCPLGEALPERPHPSLVIAHLCVFAPQKNLGRIQDCAALGSFGAVEGGRMRPFRHIAL